LLHAYRFDRYKPNSVQSRERQVQTLLVSAHHDVSGPVSTATSGTRRRTIYRPRLSPNTPRDSRGGSGSRRPSSTGPRSARPGWARSRRSPRARTSQPG
jgi:hypothetical protein